MRVGLLHCCAVHLQLHSNDACLGDCSLRFVHTHLIYESGSSVVEQAPSVPAELTQLAVITRMRHLDVPEVLRNVCLDLPVRTKGLYLSTHTA